MPSRTIRLSEALAEASDIRAERLGYENWSAYFRGCLHRDVSTLESHGQLQQIIERMSLQEMDDFEAFLLNFLKHSIRRSGIEGGGSGSDGPEAT